MPTPTQENEWDYSFIDEHLNDRGYIDEHEDEAYIEEDEDYNLNYPYEWASDYIKRWDANILNHRDVEIKEGERYYGFELEYIFRDVFTREDFIYVAKLILEQPWSNKVILVHDGSFFQDGYGAEIVSIPLKFEESLDLARQILDRKNSKVINCFKVSNSTGMHVHVSKSSMSLLTQAKILKLVYDNADWFAEVTGKDSHQYANYNELIPRKWTKRISSRNKYVAVNVTNSQTIEFRIFTAPLTYTEYRNRLLFVKAVIDFCENTPSSKITLNEFVDSPYLSKVELEYVSNY